MQEVSIAVERHRKTKEGESLSHQEHRLPHRRRAGILYRPSEAPPRRPRQELSAPIPVVDRVGEDAPQLHAAKRPPLWVQHVARGCVHRRPLRRRCCCAGRRVGRTRSQGGASPPDALANRHARAQGVVATQARGTPPPCPPLSVQAATTTTADAAAAIRGTRRWQWLGRPAAVGPVASHPGALGVTRQMTAWLHGCHGAGRRRLGLLPSRRPRPRRRRGRGEGGRQRGRGAFPRRRPWRELPGWHAGRWAGARRPATGPRRPRRRRGGSGRGNPTGVGSPPPGAARGASATPPRRQPRLAVSLQLALPPGGSLASRQPARVRPPPAS